jgi:hypothetical protein
VAVKDLIMLCYICGRPSTTHWDATNYLPFDKGPSLGFSIFFCSENHKNAYLTYRAWHYQDLDRTMNMCKYFVRDCKTMEGTYAREGKYFSPVSAYWQGDFRLPDESYEQHPFVPHDSMRFAKFLHTNGWLEDWWHPRKTLEETMSKHPDFDEQDFIKRRLDGTNSKQHSVGDLK